MSSQSERRDSKCTHNVVRVHGFSLCQHQHSHKRVAIPWHGPKICYSLIGGNPCVIFSAVFSADAESLQLRGNNLRSSEDNISITELPNPKKYRCRSIFIYCSLLYWQNPHDPNKIQFVKDTRRSGSDGNEGEAPFETVRGCWASARAGAFAAPPGGQ